MASGGLLARKWRTFRALPLFVIGWLVPVWAMIAIASAAIAIVPFRRLAALFGRPTTDIAPKAVADPARGRRAVLIGQTIRLAARYAPSRSDCYPQALTAALLCRLWRLPYALYFGLALEPAEGSGDGRFAAHAWVSSGQLTLTGGASSFARYRIVSCFVSARAEN